MNHRLLPTARLALITFILLGTLSCVAGCGTRGGEAATEWRSFRGEITWVPRGLNGFWGIQTREFGKIHPLGEISADFHTKGLPVTGELLLRGDMGSVRSWGKIAEVRNMRRQE